MGVSGLGGSDDAALMASPSPLCSPTPSSCQCFSVRSLGWVEMSEEELTLGRSSVAVNNCIRQLSSQSSELSGSWTEVSCAGGGGGGRCSRQEP